MKNMKWTQIDSITSIEFVNASKNEGSNFEWTNGNKMKMASFEK